LFATILQKSRRLPHGEAVSPASAVGRLTELQETYIENYVLPKYSQ
jgi:hypothetical protein